MVEGGAIASWVQQSFCFVSWEGLWKQANELGAAELFTFREFGEDRESDVGPVIKSSNIDKMIGFR